MAVGGEVGIKAGVFLPQGADPDYCDVKFGGHDIKLRMTIYAASLRGKPKVRRAQINFFLLISE
jgi:hypothetical protein